MNIMLFIEEFMVLLRKLKGFSEAEIANYRVKSWQTFLDFNSFSPLELNKLQVAPFQVAFKQPEIQSYVDELIERRLKIGLPSWVKLEEFVQDMKEKIVLKLLDNIEFDRFFVSESTCPLFYYGFYGDSYQDPSTYLSVDLMLSKYFVMMGYFTSTK